MAKIEDCRWSLDETPHDVALDGAGSGDEMIGRVFRLSAVAIVVVIAAAGLGVYLFQRAAEPSIDQQTGLVPPDADLLPPPELPRTRFTDITKQAGITFRHFNGTNGPHPKRQLLLPETMGSGCAFFDLDNDSDQDLLFVNSGYWPWQEPTDGDPPTMALYRNDGAGRFTDATAGSGLDVSLYGMGVAAGDYDNDGLVDLFITAVGEDRLFRNVGEGEFVDVTEQAGVAGPPDRWSTSAAFCDYNNDGLLDLFVCNYVVWSREIDEDIDIKRSGYPFYGSPRYYQGTHNALYRNEGAGVFTDVSEEAGILVWNPDSDVPRGKALGVAPFDLDRDGWIDIVVANDAVANFVYHNQRDGTFEEIGSASGMALGNKGVARAGMGIDFAYFRNDDEVACAIGNLSEETTALFVSQDNPLRYYDETVTAGIGLPSYLALTFAVFFFDYDLNGRLDLLAVNGHVQPFIGDAGGYDQTYRQPSQLFWNCGPQYQKEFALVPAEKLGRDFFREIVGRGAAYADIDDDGDLDLAITSNGERPLLLRNDQQLEHNWVRLKLVGTRANRDAIGAWVELRAGDEVFRRTVMPTRGYLSQVELPVTIGLGTTERVDEVRVIWPGGDTQQVDGVPINRETVITEGH